jgi:hypothetical protein
MSQKCCSVLFRAATARRSVVANWHAVARGRDDGWYFCFWLLHNAVVLNSLPADLRSLGKREILPASPGLPSHPKTEPLDQHIIHHDSKKQTGWGPYATDSI